MNLKKLSTKDLVKKAEKLGLLNAESMNRQQLISFIEVKSSKDEELEVKGDDVKADVESTMKHGFPKVEITTSEETQISRLRRQIVEAEIVHKEIAMPVNAIATQESENTGNELIMQFADGTKVVAGRIGLQYMAYRLKMNDSTVTDYLRNDITGAQLTDAFNTAYESIAPKKRGKMVAAIYRGFLVGMMRNYTSVSHSEIVDTIEAAGLSKAIQFSVVDMYCMNLIVSVKAFDDYVAGLRIVNGHSGHVSFRYSSAFMVNDFYFDLPMADRVRHLSSVTASVANLKSLIEAAAEIRIDEMLRKTSIRRVAEIVKEEFVKPSKRQQLLLENPEIGAECENALDYVISLSRYTKTSGYKKAAISILTKIVDTITKE